MMTTRTSALAHEFVRRRVSGPRNSLATQNGPDGQQHDLQVEPPREMVHVPYIAAQLVGPADDVAAVYLGPTGQARTDHVPAALFLRVAIEILRQERPGADEAHLAANHIYQLRHLVERDRSQPSAKRREPLGIGPESTVGRPRVGHRPEFQDRERPPAETRSNLAKENRPAVRDPHEYHCDDRHGREKHEEG